MNLSAPAVAWNRYWFSPAPLLNLAVCRLVTVGLVLGFWYRVRVPSFGSERFDQLAGLPDELYNPLPALHLLIWPVDWSYRPPVEVLEALLWIGFVAGALALVGLATNLSLALFTLVSMFLQTHAYSYGNYHHISALILIALGILALSPCGRVLSVDALWRTRRRRRRRRTRDGPSRDAPVHRREAPPEGTSDGIFATSPYARWPLRLIGWLLVLAYLSAAVSKVGGGRGLDWMNGYTLQHYMLQDGVRWDRPLGIWLSQFHELLVGLSWLTVVFEATFVLALLGPLWLTAAYLLTGVGLHLGIYVTMKAPFFGFMALYSALVPWERILRSLRRPPAITVVPETVPIAVPGGAPEAREEKVT